ncbi:N-6 DNA methylase [Tumidithrix elongata RA019]|uniref:site-specific DNA-methyltransferase (adenine-specific) n=1 Tax=Tumidithrix elongata BACA0141 TaxID=2716417 RepID=A0AAW9PX12_9CYAN|nr:N-6 DNA methylase [Tumidithrix elongata RA019]
MLDSETKRRIDTARDILVGKVPDPKSQVEQITIALIYKFMDDMDAEVEELGGDRTFFKGEFAKYGWGLLMSPSVGGHELLNLYSEGISTMPQNAGIPALFRDIFKNAYLPYRDPETLKSFLKVIDEFQYDHSERLGDAFEYLLSVLGSQGDAGQFRTPRHIIDFMVEILRPQKGEVILDPACGTAGFLISAYKHILRNNQDANGNSTLTPDEKGLMATNFKGYDISPDMVRLSLVNLYLHGFKSPQIAEYDTLTSEDKWNEFADVILANPPFMSPKGGIKPHKRFSIKAKRSEVLFVDYMAEHLTPRGRAGIIVPEGIIFQSQTAYKDLRKMLVENSLVAVISLPAGVFNPYSGVKTSILILDKSLAKKTDKIAFFKVENDGFGLGAQRRAVVGDDLPFVLEEIRNYELRITRGVGENYELGITNDDRVLIVPKSKIAANGEYNLSGERYRESTLTSNVFPLVRIGDICTINPRKNQLSDLSPDTLVSFVPMADINEHQMTFQPIAEKLLSEVTSSYTYFEDNDVLFAKVTPCFENGKAGIAKGLINGIGFGSSEFYILRSSDQVLPEFLYFCINHPFFRDPAVAQMTGTGGLQRVPRDYVENSKIPLPPIAIQKEIVAEIEGYQKVINGARAVIDNYRPHIAINPDWEVVKLSDVTESISDGDHMPPPKAENGIPFITISNINKNNQIDFSKTFFVPEEYYEALKSHRKPQKDDILYTVTGSYGIPVLIEADIKFCFQRHIGLIRPSAKINTRYLYYLLSSSFILNQADSAATGVAQKTVSLSTLRDFSIPVPPLETQKAIVAEIKAEQALVNANRELIERFEKKIQTVLNRIWGEG